LKASRPLDEEFLTTFHGQALQQLHWYENVLQQEQRQHQQTKAINAMLHQRLAEAEGRVVQVETYLNAEKQRGDTYKKLYTEQAATTDRLVLKALAPKRNPPSKFEEARGA
jgi:hypothetical protein